MNKFESPEIVNGGGKTAPYKHISEKEDKCSPSSKEGWYL